MADPRFFENLGPFALARICREIGAAVPDGVDGALEVFDLADLAGASGKHLTFFSGATALKDAFAASRAGVCLVPQPSPNNPGKRPPTPPGMILLEVASVGHAFAAVSGLFYPRHSQPRWDAKEAISRNAHIGRDVELAVGVVIGPGAEIGDNTRLGPGTVIGPGVAIGRACEIGANATISHAYIGDRVTILPGAHIGQPGFGFASSANGHVKIPQLGRVIIQDDCEIGSATCIDRGSLGDTVIGEGTKLDNLVMIGHNCHIGRHCVIAGQAGIAGSVVIEDFVVLGGQAGFGDHARAGAHARIAAQSGITSGTVLEGAKDYGGTPVKPVREWAREIHALARLARHRKQDKND